LLELAFSFLLSSSSSVAAPMKLLPYMVTREKKLGFSVRPLCAVSALQHTTCVCWFDELSQ